MRVGQFQSVTSFEPNEGVVLSIGQKLQELQKRLGGQLLQLNVPDGAPHEMPRAVLRGADTIISICFNRFDIATKPPAHVSSNLVNALNFTRLRVEPILNTLLESPIQYTWTGVVVDYNFSQKDSKDPALKIIEPVFDEMVTAKRNNRDLSSFELKFGYRESGFFTNYTVAGYENRNFKLPAVVTSKSIIELDISKLPVAESGLQIKVDINNKPSASRAAAIEDLKSVLRKHEEKFNTLFEELNISEEEWGIL